MAPERVKSLRLPIKADEAVRHSEQEFVTKAQTQGQRGWFTECSDHLSQDL